MINWCAHPCVRDVHDTVALVARRDARIHNQTAVDPHAVCVQYGLSPSWWRLEQFRMRPSLRDNTESKRHSVSSGKQASLVYMPDKYWRQNTAIPPHASAMVINDGLDFQTVREWTRRI